VIIVLSGQRHALLASDGDALAPVPDGWTAGSIRLLLIDRSPIALGSRNRILIAKGKPGAQVEMLVPRGADEEDAHFPAEMEETLGRLVVSQLDVTDLVRGVAAVFSLTASRLDTEERRVSIGVLGAHEPIRYEGYPASLATMTDEELGTVARPREEDPR
jgi:hypothetical protein